MRLNVFRTHQKEETKIIGEEETSDEIYRTKPG